ncbi:MAG: hypothetical protein ACJ763_07055 [Bdellovibrionia bacterium]
MPMQSLNCFKTRSTFLVLSAALILASPQASFAFGAKAPTSDSDSATGIQSLTNAERLQLIHTAISLFNQEHAQAISPAEYRSSQEFTFSDGVKDSACAVGEAKIRAELVQKYGPSLDPLCTKITPALEPSLGCTDLVEIIMEKQSGAVMKESGLYTYCIVTQPYTVRFYAALTSKAQQLIKGGFLYVSTNTDVEYNVRAIQSALGNLVLLPRQRKSLDGFFSANDSFVRAIDAEKANASAGKEAKPLTHRSFVEKASLIVAHYRYLKDDFAELAQFSSANGGMLKTNQDAVKVIDSAVNNLTKDYGLDSEITAKQVADYGRVLLDLLNNYSLTLTTTEKAILQPVLVQLVTQVIPASEAYGDVGAHDAVVKLKSIWESTAFTALLTDKLSVSDDKSTSLILNMSAAAYKLGLSANVDIRTFDARDADRIKNRRLN